MPRPIRSLPMAQQWDCQGCGDCCRTYAVRTTLEEKKRIEAQDWSDVPELAEVPRTVWEKRIGDFRLNHREDGACVFLGPDNRCRMHAKYGAASKPAACRIYPFTLTPAGDHWRVGVRFSCPSTIANAGHPLSQHAQELSTYAGLIEAEQPKLGELPSPPLQTGQSLPWADLFRVNEKLARILSDESKPVERKLREGLALASLCRRSSFENINGVRFQEFLDIVAQAVIDEVPSAADVPKPGWAGRMIFRQVAALYSRKDQGPNHGVLSQRGWLGRLAAGARFASGLGVVPRVHGAIAGTFRDADTPQPLSAESEALLSRFYRIKIESISYFGPPNFGLSLWDGFDTLALTYPALIWLARLIAKAGNTDDAAIALAVRTIDDNFGFNPLLGSSKQVWALKMLAARGDLPRLIAWYGKVPPRPDTTI